MAEKIRDALIFSIATIGWWVGDEGRMNLFSYTGF